MFTYIHVYIYIYTHYTHTHTCITTTIVIKYNLSDPDCSMYYLVKYNLFGPNCNKYQHFNAANKALPCCGEQRRQVVVKMHVMFCI